MYKLRDARTANSRLAPGAWRLALQTSPPPSSAAAEGNEPEDPDTCCAVSYSNSKAVTV
jgi:hypothetical protein